MDTKDKDQPLREAAYYAISSHMVFLTGLGLWCKVSSHTSTEKPSSAALLAIVSNRTGHEQSCKEADPAGEKTEHQFRLHSTRRQCFEYTNCEGHERSDQNKSERENNDVPEVVANSAARLFDRRDEAFYGFLIGLCLNRVL